jgi:hypothetical protein
MSLSTQNGCLSRNFRSAQNGCLSRNSQNGCLSRNFRSAQNGCLSRNFPEISDPEILEFCCPYFL